MTITNGTINGDWIYINTALHFGSNANRQSTFLTNASPMWATTNIFNHFASWPPFGILRSNLNSNVLVFKGVNMTLYASNFATVAWSTNALGSNQWNFMGPFDDFPQTKRVTNANELIYGIGKYGTNGFPENTNGPFAHYASLTHTQSLMNKFFSGSYWSGGIVSNVTLINVLALSGIVTALTNGYSYNLILDVPQSTNAVNWGDLCIGNPATGVANSWAFRQPVDDYLVLYNDTALSTLMSWSFNGGNFTTVLGDDSTDLFINNGTFASTYGVFGTMRSGTNFLGQLIATNSTLFGTNLVTGEWADTPRVFTPAISGYVSALNLGTNSYVRITGATAAFTNASFKGGYSGYVVDVEAVNPNSSCVLLHESSIGAPATTEKINLGTGGTSLVNITNNPATFRLRHNGTEWILLWHSN